MSTDSLAAALGWRHERVHVISDNDTGLQVVVAIHSTVLGPALGGLRLWRYEHGLAEALDDALRLSRAMTLKAAAAGLDLGGGKAVMFDDGREELWYPRLKRFAAELEALGGDYITAEDVGTTIADMDFLAKHTRYTVGRLGGGGIGGDPSPDTARTVLEAIRAALSTIDGSSELEGRVIGILGLGKVGAQLARWLAAAGAIVLGYDPVPVSIEGVKPIESQEELLRHELDVLAPCALGGLVDEDLASTIGCRVVCGAANNPVTGAHAARVLAARGVLYVPDFLANCGGLIRADAERRRADAAEVERRLDEAAERTRSVLVEARERSELPLEVAERHAWARIALGRGADAEASSR